MSYTNLKKCEKEEMAYLWCQYIVYSTPTS